MATPTFRIDTNERCHYCLMQVFTKLFKLSSSEYREIPACIGVQTLYYNAMHQGNLNINKNIQHTTKITYFFLSIMCNKM